MSFVIAEIDSEKISEIKTSSRPNWLKAKIPSGENYSFLKNVIEKNSLHTVCEEARCPNIAECWNAGTATFMILGDVCTRSCGFCNVKTGMPTELDVDEPKRVAKAIHMMKIKHAVITSVNRDELYDGGSMIFAETIREVRNQNPNTTIEVLIPDFKGEEFALNNVLDAFPDILNHNVETVPRLYKKVRPQGKYNWTIQLLQRAKQKGFKTKTGMMLGLGEKENEIFEVMKDLRKVDCDILTLGQYLQPTKNHLPVERYVIPDEFIKWKKIGTELGFKHVESSPFTRSSYHAEKQL